MRFTRANETDDELESLESYAGLSKTERRELIELGREYRRRTLADDPTHPTVEHIVDDRVFLLGLDALYRERMIGHESIELLGCARVVAATLGVEPADVAIEGYYHETPRLTKYFRLMRALQIELDTRRDAVAGLDEFKRLLSIASSGLFGRTIDDGHLLPRGSDPLTEALLDTPGDPAQWTIGVLVDRAFAIARASDDCSLVELAALARDPVVLTALRESTVLYAKFALEREQARPPVPVYIWRVDPELSRRAARFVSRFNALFDDDLPDPVEANADVYGNSAKATNVIGRCVRIGMSNGQHYHWAIRNGSDGRPEVEEFWAPEIRTTSSYRRGFRA